MNLAVDRKRSVAGFPSREIAIPNHDLVEFQVEKADILGEHHRREHIWTLCTL